MEVGRIIDAPAELVWALLTDTCHWPLWGPSVAAVRSAQRYIQQGATGKIHTAAGFWVPFTVTEFDEGSYWCWHVGGVRATGHRLESLRGSQCLLIFEVPFWAAPYLLVCKVALDRIERLATGSELTVASCGNTVDRSSGQWNREV